MMTMTNSSFCRMTSETSSLKLTLFSRATSSSQTISQQIPSSMANSLLREISSLKPTSSLWPTCLSWTNWKAACSSKVRRSSSYSLA